MAESVRKLAFTFPFGCLCALTTHYLRFGDEHAFGGEGNAAIVSAAVGGSIALALVIVHAFVAAGSTTVTGTIARTRIGALLPNAAGLFAVAASLYYGIETLEGNGIELGLPTLVLAAAALLVAWALRGLCAGLARFVVAIVRELIALLSARPLAAIAQAPPQLPARTQQLRAARRFGRAPPHERSFR